MAVEKKGKGAKTKLNAKTGGAEVRQWDIMKMMVPGESFVLFRFLLVLLFSFVSCDAFFFSGVRNRRYYTIKYSSTMPAAGQPTGSEDAFDSGVPLEVKARVCFWCVPASLWRERVLK